MLRLLPAFDGTSSDDPMPRRERTETATHIILVENEAAMRVMLAHFLETTLPPRFTSRSRAGFVRQRRDNIDMNQAIDFRMPSGRKFL
jgi:hypothetical protein